MVTHIIDFLAVFITNTIGVLGYAGTYILMLLTSCGIPIPSEISMPFSGFAVAQGSLTLVGIIIAGVLGDVSGAMLAYWIGFKGGRPLVEKYGKYILLSNHDLDIADKWFTHYGAAATFFGRVLPIIRTYISFPAGISKMSFKKFVAFSVIGSIPYVTALAYAGMKLGENWSVIREKMKSFDTAIGVVVIILLILYIWRHIKHSKK